VENLPYTLAEPLHILPWWFTLVFWALLIILLALLLKKYLGRIKEILQRLLHREPLPGRGRKKGHRIIPVIEEIEGENLKRKTYRKGLFELSEVMKSHMERASGLQVEEMTSGEISRFLRIREPGKFFRQMDLLVFREKNPGRKEFVTMFGRAKKLAKKKIKAGDKDADL
jgi:hypothetical protein